MRNNFAETLYKEAKENDKICVVVADISPAGSMQKFRSEYPERFISELFEYLSIQKDDFVKQYKLFEQPNIDNKYFELLTDTFRSPHIWRWQNDQWKLRSTVF